MEKKGGFILVFVIFLILLLSMFILLGTVIVLNLHIPTGNVYYADYNTEHLNIPKFANTDNTGDGFPNGFEVAVIGPKSSRDVLIRSVVIAHISGKVLGNEKLTIISVPQF